jgi:hypothetical protein
MNIICIPALKKHKEHLNLSLKYLANHYSINEIIIVTPNKHDYFDLEKNGYVILEDNDFIDIDKNQILEILNKNIKFLNGWYYQQFLKYSIVLKLNNYDNVIIIDADSIILNFRIMLDDIIFLNENEYHEEYFVTINKIFPDIICLSKSSINNFQNFNRQILFQMIKEIEVEGINWYLKILSLINESKQLRSFSEYETYANYANAYFNHKISKLKLFRRGDLLNIYQDKNIIISNLKNLGYDLVAFEISHNIKTSHLFYSIFLYLIINIKIYVKNFFSKFQSNK